MNNLILIEQQIKDHEREIDNLKKRLSHLSAEQKKLDNQQSTDFGRVLEWLDEGKRNNMLWRYILLSISCASVLLGIFGIWLNF
ncbi:hypothetical protein UFOVP581_50 [uncultured Caudovirales phage]|uniref:Uncharacterized protein n=1 Tax=uncultured Caudovirales phage TaxID=2100421 RepID=A0A6J5PNH5_9CAUD|nr:hypothetical protein UFOVP581_50 [uncultured Caudovirales phage]